MRKVALWSLQYLARSHVPLWGGHLKRREPITDGEMQDWVDRGLIQAVGTEGYVITEAGREVIRDAEAVS